MGKDHKKDKKSKKHKDKDKGSKRRRERSSSPDDSGSDSDGHHKRQKAEKMVRFGVSWLWRLDQPVACKALKAACAFVWECV
jgi:hypothetical protein